MQDIEIQCSVDGIPFTVHEETDFSWLTPYGTVRRVYDRLPTGNLCFLLNGAYGALFIKYAGIRTLRYRGNIPAAVQKLKNSSPLYQKAYPALPKLLNDGPVGNGYAQIFEVFPGLTLGSILSDPALLICLRSIPVTARLKMADDLFSLHASLAADGIQALDFSLSHLLIDLERSRICQTGIEQYVKRPCRNTVGMMPGGFALNPPEMLERNAPITESATVYSLGMTAFCLFGDSRCPARDTWTAPGTLFDIAAKAISPKPGQRYYTVASMLHAWREAVGRHYL